MVKGLDRLHARFEAIPKAIRDEVAREMEKQAEALVRDMRTLAPKGRTHHLVESIGWTWGDAPKGSMTIGKVYGKDYGKVAIKIYAGGGAAFYARFQEFGTDHMPAHPFFYPAFRANKRKIKSALSRAVTRAVKRS